MSGKYQVYRCNDAAEELGWLLIASTYGQAKQIYARTVDCDFVDTRASRILDEFRDKPGELSTDDPLWKRLDAEAEAERRRWEEQ